jgi:serine/threonine protein kinase
MSDHGPAPEPADVFLGHTIPSELNAQVSYRLEHLLGQGGTARAYYAIRTAPEGNMPVVVKVILPEIVRASDRTATLVIQKEAVALGRLNERIPRCPYVVRFIDTGVVPFSIGYQVLSLPWLALEYVGGGVEGSALDERVIYSVNKTGYAFDADRAARALLALSRGLDEIHAVGVVHRDLTPANVLCCGTGDTEMFKISDFGIARPIGLHATFGNIAVGTPGYVAPEQTLAAKKNVGPHTDVFALAAVTYCMLTGEHYLQARTTIDAFQETQNPYRRSLQDAAALCPELREQNAAIEAIDRTLARATAFEPLDRPRSASEFADAILPWLSAQPKSVHVSMRWLDSVKGLEISPSQLESNWLVRHPPGADRLILGAAWNADGHCLAATTSGLEYFDGAYWSRLPDSAALSGRRANNVRRLSPTTWLVAADGGRLVEVAREGTTVVADGNDPSIDFVDVDGDLDDFAVVLGRSAGRAPLLCTRIGKRWLLPYEATSVTHVSGLTRVDDDRWLVTGRNLEGQAWAGLYRPLSLELTSMPTPSARALLACASRRNRGLAVAVGGDGALLCLGPQGVGHATVPGQPDLSVLSLDVAGQLWSGSIGRLYFAPQPLSAAQCIWSDPTWQVPFVSLHAELGQLLALTVDGGVLEGRTRGYSNHG